MATETPARRSWGQALRVYGERPVLSMLFLGFSAGLPFYLVFQTLSAWLRTEHIERATIGMLSWVGLMYSFKWVWAPIVDRVRAARARQIVRPAPILDAGGADRRSPSAWRISRSAIRRESVCHVAMFALGVAFFAATQDIAIDAWRIESASADKQGAMAAAYQIGYRTALMVASAGALIIAGRIRISHELPHDGGARVDRRDHHLAGARTGARHSRERPATRGARGRMARRARALAAAGCARPARGSWARWPGRSWISSAATGSGSGLLIFAFISTYRLTDYVMGTMTNPFYIDMGFTLTEVGVVAKFFGWPSTLVGAVLGGVIVAKVGRIKGLLLGSVLIIISNVFYATYGAYACHVPLECARSGLFAFWVEQITMRGPATDLGLAAIVSFDNLALGVHGTALIAFMSSLTSAKYTATQYAVLSSLYSLPGKLLMGTSGFMVDALGYGDFFLYTALLSIPGVAAPAVAFAP